MSNLDLAFADTLLNRLSEEANGVGLSNGMGLASALMLLQEQASQGVPTLSPVKLALESLTLDFLSVEPGLTSLSDGVPANVLAALKSKAEALTWSGLIEQAKHLSVDLADATGAVDGLPLDALGLESLADLQEDLQGLENHLPDVMDIGPLNTSSSIVASLNDGTSLFDPQSIEHASAAIAQAEALKPVASGEVVRQAQEALQAQTDHFVPQIGDALSEAVGTGEAPVSDPSASVTDGSAVVVAGAGVLEPLITVVGEVTDTLEGVIGEGTLDPVIDLVDEAVEVAEQAVDGVSAAVDQVVDGVTGAVDDVLDGVVDLVEGILGEGALEPVGDLVDEVLDGASDVVSGVTDVLESVLGDGALAPVNDLVDDVLGGVSGVVEGVLGEGDALEATGDLVDDVLGGAGEVVGGVTDALEGVLGDGALEPVDDLVEDVLGGVSGVVEGVLGDGDPVASVGELVDDLLGAESIEPVTEALEQALAPVTDVVESALAPVADLVDSLPLVGGILPLVGGESNDDGSGSLLGGLLS